MRKGFTLVEVLLVVAITAILATITLAFSYGIRSRKDLDLAVNSVAAVVRDAQQKSITQEDMTKWGVHLGRNSISIYDLFKDVYAAANILSAYQLPHGVEFNNGDWGGTTHDITFTQVDGLPTGGQHVIIIQLTDDSTIQRQITISNNGTVSY